MYKGIHARFFWQVFQKMSRRDFFQLFLYFLSSIDQQEVRLRKITSISNVMPELKQNPSLLRISCQCLIIILGCYLYSLSNPPENLGMSRTNPFSARPRFGKRQHCRQQCKIFCQLCIFLQKTTYFLLKFYYIPSSFLTKKKLKIPLCNALMLLSLEWTLTNCQLSMTMSQITYFYGVKISV